MGEICGVCQQNESKYKCPSCHLRYCSIACFKQHKETHLNDTNPPKSTHPPKPIPSATQTSAPQTTAAPVTRSKKPTFANFESDPELVRLLSRYPNLRIQLQSVYGLTLEPAPPSSSASSYRGSGGRGRGRGGRFQNTHSHWTQAKGDKEALESFRNMRNAEGDDERGLTEFVQLIKMRFADVEGEGEGT